jgi:signal transduction histidine kinase
VLGARGGKGGFDEADLDLLVAFANQAAVAIENAQLYEQAQQMAVLQERGRLARDQHDAVTQTLFSATLIAEALPDIWTSDQAEGKQLLQELRQLSRGALAEMRTLLLELRPATLMEVNLEELLRQLTEAARGRARIPIELQAQITAPLPPDVKVALYYIAQEALNNVAKHARASSAYVNLATHPSGAVLSVLDDGLGFDIAQVTPEHLGLAIMRERSESIDGELTIESAPGEGTEITIRWTNPEIAGGG